MLGVDAFAPAKLRRPEPRLALFERPGVAAALRSIPEQALTCVIAPAGYGKTVAVSRWAAAAELPVAWLRLDAGDEDPGRLIAGLLAAVAVARPELRPPSWPEPGAIVIERWLTRRLLVPLAEQGGSLVVVLDDAELRAGSALASTVAFLLANAGPALHLCVIGREPPELPLARLEARGELARIGVETLALSTAELRALAAEVLGREPSEEEFAWLERSAKGWPVAARLLAVGLREGRRGRPGIVDRRALRFVIEEVVDRLAPDLRRLLIETAILDELEPEACVAVSGRADAGERLWAALDSGLLIGAGEGARAHPLLREALLGRLATLGEDERRELHRRASRSFARRGRIAAALDHGVAGADVVGLAALARERGWTLLRAGSLDALGRLIAAVDEAGLELGSGAGADPLDRAHVAVLRAWSTLPRGPGSTRAALERAREQLEEGPPCGAQGQARERSRGPSRVALLRSLTALEALCELREGDPSRDLARAEAALVELDLQPDPEQRGLAVVLRLAIALASELSHDWARALEALARAAGDAGSTPPLPSLAAIASHRVRLLRRLARVSEAVELGEAARTRLAQLGWDRSPAAGALELELALVELLRGRHEEAERAALRGLAAVELGGDPLAHVRGLIALARVRRARGCVEELDAALAEARRRCEQAPLGHLKLLVAAEAEPFAVRVEQLAALGPLKGLLISELRFARAAAWLRGAGEQGERSELVAELEAEQRAAEQQGRRLDGIQARILLAALLAEREPARAAALLRAAAAVAEPEQLRGPFVAARERLRTLGEALPEWVAELVLGSGPAAQVEPSEPASPLSERELEILAEIARGLPNRLIASALHISLATVKTHVHHILAKLEVRNRTEAVHRARALGLLD